MTKPPVFTACALVAALPVRIEVASHGSAAGISPEENDVDGGSERRFPKPLKGLWSSSLASGVFARAKKVEPILREASKSKRTVLPSFKRHQERGPTIHSTVYGAVEGNKE